MERDTARLAAEAAHSGDVETVHVTDGKVEVRSTMWSEDGSVTTEVIEPDEDGLFHIGSHSWTWSEHNDRPADRTMTVLRSMRPNSYKTAGPDKWLVVFADHGWRMVLLALRPDFSRDPLTSLFTDLLTAMHREGISSYSVTADSAATAYSIARRHFAAARAGTGPAAASQPIAMPFNVITAPSS